MAPRTGLDLFAGELIFSIKTEPDAWCQQARDQFEHRLLLKLWALRPQRESPVSLLPLILARRSRRWSRALRSETRMLQA